MSSNSRLQLVASQLLPRSNAVKMTANGTTNGPQQSIDSDQLLYINGKYVPANSGSTFPVVNPMTGKPIYHCAAANIYDYGAAIESAKYAFEDWSQTSPSKRRLIMLKAADIMESYMKQDAPQILSEEVSATEWMVKLNIFATAGIFRETAGLATHIKGEVVPADRPGTTIMVLREALGVVFAISPWNSPVKFLVAILV